MRTTPAIGYNLSVRPAFERRPFFVATALASLSLITMLACPMGSGIEAFQPDGSSLSDGSVADSRMDASVGSDAETSDLAPGDAARVDAAPAPLDAATADSASPVVDAALPADASLRPDAHIDAAVPIDASIDDGVSAGDTSPSDSGPAPGADSDGDGLDDAWEWAAGDPARLDWQLADTDGDGTWDGLEDPDGDMLDNLSELAAQRLPFWGSGPAPHPLRRDLLVELDAMAGALPSDAVLDLTTAVFANLPLSNVDGSQGAALHFVLDQTSLAVEVFDGGFDQRNNYLRDHGLTLVDDGLSPALPLDQLIHVVVAMQRSDLSTRGGETVAANHNAVESSGVFVYHDAIANLHPACGRPVDPILPDISVEEALATTLAHELGHVVQLGHDTAAGGGINYYNIMSLPTGCLQAQQRMHGDGNSDPDLGSTQPVFAPRFSTAAAGLMRFDRRISVDVADFDQAGGYDM